MNKKLVKIKFLTSVLLVFCFIFLSTVNASVIKKNNNEIDELELVTNTSGIQIIRVAQYPRETGSDESIDVLFNYIWTSNGSTYKFNILELTLEEIRGHGERPLNNDNFDLLFVGASFYCCFKDGFDDELIENIKNFISNGGGYIGVCAGAVFASQGYENTNTYYKKHINDRILGIANVFINCEIDGEGQYIWKLGSVSSSNQSLLPLEMKINKTTTNPIFEAYNNQKINMSYGGGPGLYIANENDPKLGEIIPLLYINEELMETKPIHTFNKRFIGWKEGKTIQTDMKGQFGCIATIYGKGKVVLFTGHPEISFAKDGVLEEYIGKSTGYGLGSFFNPVKGVYKWTGPKLNLSYNWWIHRRTAAWIADVPNEELPPGNELMVFIDKPAFRFGNWFYINESLDIISPAEEMINRILAKFGRSVVIGDITVEAYAENSDLIEFYLDDVLEFTDYEQPFRWVIDKNNFNGVHRLEIRGYDEFGNVACEGSEYLFVNT